MVMYQAVIHFDLQAAETADATVSLSRARARAVCVMLQIYINLYPNFAKQTNMDAIHVQVRSEPSFWCNSSFVKIFASWACLRCTSNAEESMDCISNGLCYSIY